MGVSCWSELGSDRDGAAAEPEAGGAEGGALMRAARAGRIARPVARGTLQDSELVWSQVRLDEKLVTRYLARLAR